jgi:phosphatidylserine/phosphatidylglycerophosphate/cardiolipin synthase-like enzyme
MQTFRGIKPEAGLVGSFQPAAPESFGPVVAAIKARPDLRTIPGVFGVRPGFRRVNGELSGEPAIIVVTKTTETIEGIPTQIDGIPVELRAATALELVEGLAPLSSWEGALPEAAPQIAYTPPNPPLPDQPLPVRSITCHVGPDSGWKTLEPFLANTTSSLTIAMYEFYAEHIVDTMLDLGEGSASTLDIILQVSSNDEDIENALTESWGDRLQFTRASVSGPHRVFNNSYHTKVAVRDSSSMWLSSGNWSPSSQPLIAPGSEQTLYRKGNREWHVIIDDEPISQLFERFIRHDISQAREAGEPEAAPVLPDLLVPMAFLEAEAAVVQPHPFEKQSFATSGDPVPIKVLMSPDNYATETLQLIQQAEETLYLQFSYIRQPSRETFDNIITAIADKMEEGLDVRVLVGSNQTPAHSEQLIGQRGWKPSMFRRQTSKIHNKGILVDGKIAVVGSNNWSSDGTQYNRDASLVIHSQPIASYFSEVFLFDWNNLSRPISTTPEIEPTIASDAGPTPLGMVRIPWQAWFDE